MKMLHRYKHTFYRLQNLSPKHKLIIIFLLFVIASIGLLLLQLSKKQIIDTFARVPRNKTIILSLSSAQSKLVPGQETTVQLLIDSQTYPVAAAEILLTYPTDQLTVEEITAGSFLPVVLLEGVVSGNSISITLGAQPNAPPSGKGVLVKVRFRALPTSSGHATINLDPQTQIVRLSNMPVTVTYPNPLRLLIR